MKKILMEFVNQTLSKQEMKVVKGGYDGEYEYGGGLPPVVCARYKCTLESDAPWEGNYCNLGYSALREGIQSICGSSSFSYSPGVIC